ncbi:MAG: hypothetical protein H6721_10680 [Sandaracinus sp.]|nr:hypothetical protein [Sandaracinus sp.]MCB9632584.1 hypothetical protein [Sandaracinus sp.]
MSRETHARRAGNLRRVQVAGNERRRVWVAATFFVVGAPLVLLGLPLVALGAAVAAPKSSRGVAAALAASSVTTWWLAAWWCVDGASPAWVIAFAALAAFVAPLTLTPFVEAERARAPRVRLVSFLGVLASLAPLVALSPLVGLVLGATAFAGLLGAWAASIARGHVEPTSSRSCMAALMLTLGSWWAVVLMPSAAAPGALAEARAFDGPARVGALVVTPHVEGFVVEVADGGGAGLVRTGFGAPERWSWQAHTRELCVGRDERVVCTRLDEEGVRRDDGTAARVARRGPVASLSLAVVVALLVWLGLLARPGARGLKLAITLAALVASVAPWID